MKRIDLDKLETELERWRGEVPLPCEVVVAMVAELRYWRDRAAKEVDAPTVYACKRCGDSIADGLLCPVCAARAPRLQTAAERRYKR